MIFLTANSCSVHRCRTDQFGTNQDQGVQARLLQGCQETSQHTECSENSPHPHPCPRLSALRQRDFFNKPTVKQTHHTQHHRVKSGFTTAIYESDKSEFSEQSECGCSSSVSWLGAKYPVPWLYVLWGTVPTPAGPWGVSVGLQCCEPGRGATSLAPQRRSA